MATAGALNNANVDISFTDIEGEFGFVEVVIGAGTYTLDSLHFYAANRNAGGSFNDFRLAVYSGSSPSGATKVYETVHYNSGNPITDSAQWQTATAASESFSGPNVYLVLKSGDGVNMWTADGADAGGITDTVNTQKTTGAAGAPSGSFPANLPDDGADWSAPPMKLFITYTAGGGGATLMGQAAL